MKSYNGFTPAERTRAMHWARAERAAGRKAYATECHACLQTFGIIEPHSEDYSEPYGDHIGQFHLCYLCHMMVHCRFRAPEAWNFYRQALKAGLQWPAQLKKDFGYVTQMLGGQHRDEGVPKNPARAHTVLDEIHAGIHDPRNRVA